jgi:hypothetical protein
MRRLSTALAVAVTLTAGSVVADPAHNAVHEKAVATMAANPAAAERVLRRPQNGIEQLDYVLFLHAFKPPSKARNRTVQSLLALLKNEIEKGGTESGEPWLADEAGPLLGYDGSDKSLIPYIVAASLTGAANSEPAYYSIPCDVLQRRPGLLEATHARFGSNRDNFTPRAGCDWGRGNVRGFPTAAVYAYQSASEIADKGGDVFPQGSIWYAYWAERNFRFAQLQIDPRALLKQPRPLFDYPYQTWGYLSISNHAVVRGIRRSYGRALSALTVFYRRGGLSAAAARRAATTGLLQLPIGALCGNERPRKSLRTLILDGASLQKINAFLRTGTWRNPAREEALAECKEYGGFDPMAHIAIRDAAIFRRLEQFAAGMPADQRSAIDLNLDPNAVNEFGKTPLMTAAQYDLLDSAKLLLERGAMVNARNSQEALYFGGRTALHYAAQSGSLAMMELLVAHGADRTLRDVRGAPFYYMKGDIADAGNTAADYLVGKGPALPKNPRLSPADSDAAIKLLTP